MENKKEIFTETVRIDSLSELERNYLLKAMENPSACHLCGCTGIHACVGYPIIWTEEDKLRLKKSLGKMFNWEK
jgi:hypothetical protein